MITQSRIPSFSREDLDLPVTWQTLNEVHIPLSFAFRKVLYEVGLQIVVFILATIPVALLSGMTFRPFMHAIKPWIDDVAIRSNIYIAVVVVSLWILSRLICRTSLKRLKFLLHLIPVLLMNLQMTFSYG